MTCPTAHVIFVDYYVCWRLAALEAFPDMWDRVVKCLGVGCGWQGPASQCPDVPTPDENGDFPGRIFCFECGLENPVDLEDYPFDETEGPNYPMRTLSSYQFLTSEDQTMKMYGPYKLELAVQITDGEQVAEVKYGLPSGVAVTKEMVDEGLQESLAAVITQMGDGWRLATKEEFFNSIVLEKTGSTQKFALAGGREWSAWDAKDEKSVTRTEQDEDGNDIEVTNHGVNEVELAILDAIEPLYEKGADPSEFPAAIIKELHKIGCHVAKD